MKRLLKKSFKFGYETVQGNKPNMALNVAVVVVIALLMFA